MKPMATDSAASLTSEFDLGPPTSILPVAATAPVGLVAGKFRVFATLGRGGMADVFLAAARGLAGFNKLVVLKTLREARVTDPAFVSMFLDEARLAARLNHPNVVHTYEIGEHEDAYFIAMEYLEGQPLHRVVRALARRGLRMAPTMAAHLLAEALRGLHYAHEMTDYDGSSLGIVHRDVSPQNLHVAYDGQMRVLDFGIAKAALNTSETQVGVLKGKFSYMSPEQASGDDVDRRSDIFSAGIVLWEILTGERLFRGDNAITLSKLLLAEVDLPSSRSTLVPAALDEIVMCALRRDASERYATAYEMANALEDFIHGTGGRVRREDITRCLDDLFGEQREETRRQIQTHMAALPPALVSTVGEGPVETHTGAGASLASASGVVQRPAALATANGNSSLPIAFPTLPPPEAAVEANTGERANARRKGTLRVAVAAVGVATLAGVAWGARARFDTREGAKVRPTEAAMLSHAGAAAPEAESFHLTLSSDPLETQVEWAGKPVGQTPMLIDLLAGPQTLVLSRDGYFNASVVVNVTSAMAGTTQSRTVVLVPRGTTAVPPATPHVLSAATERTEPRGVTTRPFAFPAEPQRGPGTLTRADSVVSARAGDPALAPSSTVGVGPLAIGPGTVDATRAGGAPSTPSSPTPTSPSASPPSGSAVLPFGPEMSRPVLLGGDSIIYTREAMLSNVEGVMIARCTITNVGSLQNCRVIRGLPFMDKALLDALATRRYSPVVFQGKTIAVEYVFNVKVVRPG